jgi:hypothetical protein
MSEQNWLISQLKQAKEEVQSWDEWKQSAMLRGAITLSSTDGSATETPKSEPEPASRTPAED